MMMRDSFLGEVTPIMRPACLTSRRCSLIFFCLALTSFAAPASGGQKDFTRHKIAVVRLRSDADIQKVLELESADEDFDIWSEGVGIGTIDVRVSPLQLAVLEQSGLEYYVLVPDVQSLVTAERAAGGQGFFDVFRTNAEITAYLNDLVVQYPLLASMVNFGPSIEGRPIMGIHITGSGADKPGVLFHGCQHAREWLTPPTVAYVAQHLLARYDSDPFVRSLVDNIDWYLLPVMNPDGYEFSWTTDRFWRKNRRGGYGVDLNRNWGFHWGGLGSSGSQSSDVYRGAFAFSEPETQALRDFFLGHPNVRGHIDLHTYGPVILWPWAYANFIPPDHLTFAAIAGTMRNIVKSVHGLTNGMGPAYSTLYPAAGASIDWVYGVAGRWSLTMELRGPGFAVPPSMIQITTEENLPALLFFGAWTAACDPNNQDMTLTLGSTLPDCDGNGEADVCQLVTGTIADCNGNLVADACDISGGTSSDCGNNGIPDECEPDCNHDGLADSCNIALGQSADCNFNGKPDECDVNRQCGPSSGVCGVSGSCLDPAGNGGLGCECAACCLAICALDPFCCNVRWDQVCALEASTTPECSFTGNGQSQDCNENLIPDECEADCNGNSQFDGCDIASGSSRDCDGNSIPDECQADADQDGHINPCDNCPSHWNIGQQDRDLDGVGDACDPCPYDPLPDSDGDGTCDSTDGCPFDSQKTSAGQCGCGVPDVDTDADTVADCVDQCPGEDDRIDANENGTPDCLEPTIIPTVSVWGAMILTLLLLIASKVVFCRRRSTVSP